MILNVARTQISLFPKLMRYSLHVSPLQQMKTLNGSFLVSKRLASKSIFKQKLGMTEPEVKKLLSKYTYFLTTTDETVAEAADYLRSLCNSKDTFATDILKAPFILKASVSKLTNKSLILLECGFQNVRICDLQSFHRLTKRRLAVLKAHGYIPNELSVIPHILSKIPGVPPEAVKEIQNKSEMQCEDNYTLATIYQHVLLHYLCWRLNSDTATIIGIFDRYHRLKNRSITFIEETINIMNELGFTTDFILRNGFLLHAYPKLVKTLLKKVPILGGIPLPQAILRCPKIMLHNYKLILDMQNMLYKYGIRDEAIRRCLQIFTLSIETARGRIENFLKDPFIGCLIGHPRILISVVYNRIAQERLEILRDFDLRCFSLQMVSCASESMFEKFTSNREDRTNGDDIVFFLSHVLNCDGRKLRTSLNYHSHWHHIALTRIYSNLTLLASRGFTPDLIRNSVHILLYPTMHIEPVLDSLLYTKPEDAEDWSHKLYVRNIYHELFTSKYEEIDNDSVLNNKSVAEDLKNVYSTEIVEAQNDFVEWNLVLPMCLYILEKPYHFTGAGVWACDKNEQEITISSY